MNPLPADLAGLLLLAALTILPGTPAIAAPVRLTVSAGEHARNGTLVEFVLPPDLRAPLELAGPTGPAVPIQVGPDRQASFVLPELDPGKTLTYTLRTAASPPKEALRAVRSEGVVRLEQDGRHAFSYQAHPGALPAGRPDLNASFTRGGYIHPVLTPGGKLVTDDYPPNHRHHHGIWYAWTKTGFEGRSPDFWNMGDRKGTVEFVSLDSTWSGPVHAGFTATHRQVDLTSGHRRVALDETWAVRLLNVTHPGRPAAHVFDVVVTDRCAGAESLRLPKYRYGGIGLRGHREWDGAGNMEFLNNEGVRDRSHGDNAETRGNWAYIGGKVDGAKAGIALLGHPANPNPPQPQRIHPTEPFLCFAPQQAGDLAIEPGKPLTQRYRFIVFDGPPIPDMLDRLWDDFAHPPTVVIEP